MSENVLKDNYLAQFYYSGDAILLRAFDQAIYNPELDDVPEGIIQEMKRLHLIDIIRGKLVLKKNGKSAINAGGLENYLNKKEQFRFNKQLLPVFVAGTVIVIGIAYLLYTILILDKNWDGMVDF